MVVTGSLKCRPEKPLRNATAFLRVRDVSLADAPAQVIAEQVVTGLSSNGNEMRVRFEFEFPARKGAAYSLEAHISLSGKPEIEPGDYLTTQSYPIPTRRGAARVEIEARRI